MADESPYAAASLKSAGEMLLKVGVLCVPSRRLFSRVWSFPSSFLLTVAHLEKPPLGAVTYQCQVRWDRGNEHGFGVDLRSGLLGPSIHEAQPLP